MIRKMADADRRAVADVAERDDGVLVVDGHRLRVHTGAEEHVEDVEDAQRIERAEDERDEDRGNEQRERDPPELMPLARPVDVRRLVQLVWDHLKPCEQEQGDERRRLPDVDRRDGRKRLLRDPRHRAVDDVEADEGVVDDAEDVVVHPLPHLRRDHGRYRPRHEHDRAHHAAPLEARVDDERDDHPEHELDGDRDHGELHRHDDRVPEDGVVDEVAVVVAGRPTWSARDRRGTAGR